MFHGPIPAELECFDKDHFFPPLPDSVIVRPMVFDAANPDTLSRSSRSFLSRGVKVGESGDSTAGAGLGAGVWSFGRFAGWSWPGLKARRRFLPLGSGNWGRAEYGIGGFRIGLRWGWIRLGVCPTFMPSEYPNVHVVFTLRNRL